MPTCGRCGTHTNITTMSYFNTETICMKCQEKEMKHPDYQRAVDADREATEKGNYNFLGIGKPADL